MRLHMHARINTYIYTYSYHIHIQLRLRVYMHKDYVALPGYLIINTHRELCAYQGLTLLRLFTFPASTTLNFPRPSTDSSISVFPFREPFPMAMAMAVFLLLYPVQH